jgi:hypothetical protein
MLNGILITFKEMKIMKKILLALVVLAFMATPAVAGNQPEFDAVGCDAINFFNDFVKDKVCYENKIAGYTINKYSKFAQEKFWTSSGQLWPDPCFSKFKESNSYVKWGWGKEYCDLNSGRTGPFNTAEYEWTIVLQKKPTTDLDLNIRDCVLVDQGGNPWTGSSQTGRFFSTWKGYVFIPSANPAVTVTALPGQYAATGFEEAFTLDARPMPGLYDPVLLEGALYTSKSLWEESLVIKIPKTGKSNAAGDPEFDLHAGDIIKIRVEIPQNNPVEVYYGADNVVLKYVGEVNSDYIALDEEGYADKCGYCGECEEDAYVPEV